MHYLRTANLYGLRLERGNTQLQVYLVYTSCLAVLVYDYRAL